MSTREMEQYRAADRSAATLGPLLRQAVREATPGELDRERALIAADLVPLYASDPDLALETVVCLGHRCPHAVTAEVRTAALTAWARRAHPSTGADWDSLCGAVDPEAFLPTLVELVDTGRCVPADWFWSAVQDRLVAGPAEPDRTHLESLVAALAAAAYRFAKADDLERARSSIAEVCRLGPDPARELLRLALELISAPERDLRAEFAALDGSDPFVATWSALATCCAGEPGRASAELRDVLLLPRGAAPAGLRSASRMLLAVLDGDGPRIAAAARAALERDGDGWARTLPVPADVLLPAVADVDEPLLRRLLAGLDPATVRPDVRVHAAGTLIAAARDGGFADPDRKCRLAMARTLLEAS